MKVYGYMENSSECIELEEASIYCSIEELDNIIQFLQFAKEQHMKVRNTTPMCHSHYRDWNKMWKKEETDLILATPFKETL